MLDGERQMQSADLQTHAGKRGKPCCGALWNALTDSLSLKFKSFKRLA